MEQFVFDYLERLESRNTDQSKKAVGAVSGESAKLGKEEHEHEWTYQYHWNDEYGYRCTASPAPKKRKVRDDTSEDHEVRDGLSDPTETKGKGKGKGPKGGCHECGGDHYVRDCPVRASKGKGKGKGKTSWDWVPQKHWTSYNPGFRKTQWNDWRPKGKGKGKGGKGLAFGSPPAMQFVYPPLGNVSSGNSWQEGECDWHQGGWQDCGANSGLWIGQLTQLTSAKEKEETFQVVTKKKAARFKNTKEFDQVLHRAKTFYQHVMSPTMKDGSVQESSQASILATPSNEVQTPTLKTRPTNLPLKGLCERSSPRRGESDVRESGTVSNEKLESGLKVKHLKMLMKMKMDRLGAVDETMENTGTEAKWRRFGSCCRQWRL